MDLHKDESVVVTLRDGAQWTATVLNVIQPYNENGPRVVHFKIVTDDRTYVGWADADSLTEIVS